MISLILQENAGYLLTKYFNKFFKIRTKYIDICAGCVIILAVKGVER